MGRVQHTFYMISEQNIKTQDKKKKESHRQKNTYSDELLDRKTNGQQTDGQTEKMNKQTDKHIDQHLNGWTDGQGRQSFIWEIGDIYE